MNNNIDQVLNELYKFSKKVLSLNKPLKNELVIENFEKKHGITLPEDFKYLLHKHDGFNLMGVEVYGFNGLNNLETVYDYEHFEVLYPQYAHLVPFSPDGFGNFYCFDTSKKTDDSCHIVFWVSNYKYSNSDIPEIVNKSFSEWLKKVVIDWTLDDYDYGGNEK